MTTSLLCPDAFLSPLEIDAAVARALAEDLGRAGDVTSIATIPEDMAARAVVVARNAGVISGLPLVAATFAKLAPGIEIKAPARDGASVAKTALMTLTGPARAVLAGERVALNFLGHLSGVATATHEFVRPRRRHTHAHRAARVRPLPAGAHWRNTPCARAAVLTTAARSASRCLSRTTTSPPRAGYRRCSSGRKAAAGHLVEDRDRGRHPRSVARGARGQASPTRCCSTTWMPPPVRQAVEMVGGTARARGLGRHHARRRSRRSRRPASTTPRRAG